MLTVLTGAEVFSPESLGRRDILIGGNQILAVGTGLAGLVPATTAGVRVIDLTGTRLTPGLIDSHFHPLGGGDLAGPDNRRGPVDLNSLFQLGITTAVGVLAADTKGRTIAGLSLLGQGWRQSGFTLLHYCGSVADPNASITGSVQEDLVHIHHCMGVKLAISEPLCCVTEETLADVATAAVRGSRMAGKRGVVHLHVGSLPSGLDPLYGLIERTGLPDTAFQPTHVNRLDPDLMANAIPFVERGGTVDLTATLPLGSGPSDRLGLSAALVRLLGMGAPISQITFSSDGNVTLPVRDAKGTVTGWMPADVSVLLDSWREVVLQTKRSFTEALLPMTQNPARVLGLADRKGRITAGADADLVAWTDALVPMLVIADGQIVVDNR